MINQTVLPDKWIVVDDGSTDNTYNIIESFSKKHAWMKILKRENRGYRKPGGGVMEAFYDGFAAIGDSKWDFLVKLDGDLAFAPDYFKKCLGYFLEDKKLGIGGGTVCYTEKGYLKIESQGDPIFHVRGATKIYRKNCWEDINPLIMSPGWDTVDEVKANMLGWNTRTFGDIKIVQLKATGSADGAWRDGFKNGLGSYIIGYHPIFIFGKFFKRVLLKRDFIRAIGLFTGFCSGYLKKIRQTSDKEVIKYLRNQQIRHILLRSSIYKKIRQ